MYIKNGNLAEIAQAAYEIKRLTTLEHCGLADEFTDKQKRWLNWFNMNADKILAQLPDDIKNNYC